MSKSYLNFINKLKKFYNFKYFDEKINNNNNIILRHDVDYDLDYALNIAKLNNKLRIKSTFFVLLRSNFYNLISPHSINILKHINNLGAKIGLHYNESIYKENFRKNFLKEIEILENFLNKKVNIISFHRSSIKLLNKKKKYFNFNHTYMSKFTKNIKYYSDSMNQFRFGNPLKSEEFKSKKSMQILLHPIWWQDNFKSNSDLKFNKYFNKTYEDRKYFMSLDSKIY